jgi:hypothetical protein
MSVEVARCNGVMALWCVVDARSGEVWCRVSGENSRRDIYVDVESGPDERADVCLLTRESSRPAMRAKAADPPDAGQATTT